MSRPVIFTPRPERQPDAETMAWIETIERIRLDEAPASCPTCGCTTPHLPETRRCLGPCGRTLAISRFSRNRSARGGRRHYVCSDCDAGRKRAARQQAKVQQFRAMLGAAS